MNISIRAHRILSAILNYKKVDPKDKWPLELADGRLGEAIGCYRNSESEDDIIGIFSDGMAWRESGHLVELRFADLVQVDLPNGKESEGLLLVSRDGRQQQLPVKGRHGQFFDSMEMLRFVDRVMKDL